MEPFSSLIVYKYCLILTLRRHSFQTFSNLEPFQTIALKFRFAHRTSE